jgi:hypothetical protein
MPRISRAVVAASAISTAKPTTRGSVRLAHSLKNPSIGVSTLVGIPQNVRGCRFLMRRKTVGTGIGSGGDEWCRRYSPAAVVAVSKEVVTGDPDQYISTSYVERQNLSLRMGQRRFTRLTNGFSKKLDNHVAAVALYVAHYNLCRVHEALRTTPAKALGVADRAWTIAQLVERHVRTISPAGERFPQRDPNYNHCGDIVPHCTVFMLY